LVATIPASNPRGLIDAALLRRIPGCEQGEPPLQVQPLPGGRCANSVLRVDTCAGRFVLRERRAPIHRPGASPEQELLAHTLAARAGLAPQVLAAAPDGRWILMEYLDAPVWTVDKLMTPQGLECLCQQLQVLHQLPLHAAARPFDPIGIARGQVESILRVHPDRRGAAESVLAQVDAAVYSHAEVSARFSPIRPALNHGDLQASNILGPALLVDWEYAQWTDPAWDIAVLLTYYPELRMRSPALLEAAGLSGVGQQARLDGLLGLFAALNTLWMLAEDVPSCV
jgi:aminoglycoside phosphotransferase (APT) family kinase protein